MFAKLVSAWLLATSANGFSFPVCAIGKRVVSQKMVQTRRHTLTIFGGGMTLLLPSIALAAPRKSSAADAGFALANIKKARIELDKVEVLLNKGDYDGAAAILDSAPISDFEKDGITLVTSPALSAEDKKAIGTIRRCVAAYSDCNTYKVVTIGLLFAAHGTDMASGPMRSSCWAASARRFVTLTRERRKDTSPRHTRRLMR
jgi:hypothetical protein